MNKMDYKNEKKPYIGALKKKYNFNINTYV